MLEKNVHIQIREAIKIHTKWILKLFGLIMVNSAERDDGMNVPVSN